MARRNLINFYTQSVEYKAKSNRLSLIQPFITASYHKASLAGIQITLLNHYDSASPLFFLLSPLWNFAKHRQNTIALLSNNFWAAKLTLNQLCFLLAQMH